MSFTIIKEKWNSCKAERDQYTDLWEKIAKYTAIRYRDSIYSKNDTKNQQLDKYVDDATSALAVQQAGDYMTGILWGTGEKALELVPSRYVKQIAGDDAVEDYFKWASESALYHINHPRANFSTALMSYSYASWSFGTAGIGAFRNQSFFNNIDDNCITFRSFNVDTISIAEGISGKVEYVFSEYQWETSRIIREFCFTTGQLDDNKLGKMPKAIQEAYKKNNLNQTFNIVCAMYPRDSFNPKFKGKRGARYQATWFESESMKPFSEEDFKDLPISIARMIKVPNEIYGRSPMTIMISTIRMLNFIMGETIEALEKLVDPNLWTYAGAFSGDDVIDTSAGEMLFLDPEMAQYGNPLNPSYQVGDITGIINYLVPRLENQITTAGKVDVLLDFNTDATMTATESLQRGNIRAKSLAGIMTQQKNELMSTLMTRCVNICYDAGELGINPITDPDKAQEAMSINSQMIIPEAVLEVMETGKPWFDIKFNNEMEDIVNSRQVEKGIQQLNLLMMGSQLSPVIAETEDLYTWYKDNREALGIQGELELSKSEFKEKLESFRQAQMSAMATEQGEIGSKTVKNLADAGGKDGAKNS